MNFIYGNHGKYIIQCFAKVLVSHLSFDLIKGWSSILVGIVETFTFVENRVHLHLFLPETAYN